MNHADYYEITGRFLEAERVYISASARNFADRIGITHTTLYRIFSGNPATRIETLRRIEKEFGWPDKSLDALRRGDITWLEAHDFPAESLRRYREIILETHPDIQASTA
jgi:transcriptional regulator with XRE-family HTH domain